MRGINLLWLFEKNIYNNKRISFNLYKVWKSYLGLVYLAKFDAINQLILLSVILLRGFHCLIKPDLMANSD